MNKINMAILGPGGIAKSMAKAMAGLADVVNCYGVASRDIEKAKRFAKEWNFQKAYGSYEDLVNDPQVDLIYVATPHSHHFEHAKLCINHGKAALVEKAFTVNAGQAEELLNLAEDKKVFISEAMWTRFLPAKNIVKSIIDEGIIGDITEIEAEFSMPLTHKERLYNPGLAGGALLDLGIYAITFASMYFGDDIQDVKTKCIKYNTGVDDISETIYSYKDGKKAVLRTSFTKPAVNEGTIKGHKGSIYVKELNNYSEIKVFDENKKLIKNYPVPQQINGYEYEVLACIEAMKKGKLQCDEMPHKETIEILRQMDRLRNMWDVKYPFED